MSNVRRVFAEKKEAFSGSAKDLASEIRSYLGIRQVRQVRILIRYDIENISDDVFRKACRGIFAEPPVDILYEETFPVPEDAHVFAVEFLPGQYDQRADSAEQCIRFLKEDETPTIRSAVVYVVCGDISGEEMSRIKSYCINPVDSREAASEKPETLQNVFEEPADIAVFEGFCTMDENSFRELYDSLNLAMTFQDFVHIRNYFSQEEHRDPTVTEIRVLDTYWSDHCRHTTFSTELKNVTFEDGFCREAIEGTWKNYLADREIVHAGKDGKYICLMDLALIGMKRLKMEGKLEDQEESDEINACSIIIPVKIDDREEEWLLNFKNETHNHPTEIEPFGGAATCLGGAIRDPLSGRTYVYQAMRVTGAADPTQGAASTLTGKLPQKKLVREAARGYSSYGNQIGLATGYVREFYHPDYVAKRMEIGAVLGAAPRKDVRRLTSDPGNEIILLGGRTGRDGIGGATGSSKAHTTQSIEVCGAEVQKGNAPTERKLQRMFRRPEVTRLIRKCNDFGAGGVCVAIGELADGLRINLDLVPKKYAGLDGTEIAISESQERMAVVVRSEDRDEFLRYAAEENLEATPVAVVTEDPRLVLTWRGREIVNLSRAFLNTNGAHQETDALVEMPDRADDYFVKRKPEGSFREACLKMLGDLNCCSQRGLVEMFDSSIGAGTVLMPYGGKYQRTPSQTMVAKIPVLSGECSTVSMMSCGFDPYLSSWSPYHGAYYAVLESVARIAAAGGDYRKIRFTFQEYFRRMSQDPGRWSQPVAALLGAYRAQMELGLPSIGGKDSMSGTFQDIDVPPTLVSFAVDTASAEEIISPEFKQAGSALFLFTLPRDEYELPDCEAAKDLYGKIHEDILAGRILSAMALDGHGAAYAAGLMAFGNHFGAALDPEAVTEEELFAPGQGWILAEVAAGAAGSLRAEGRKIGEVTAEGRFTYGNEAVALEEALSAWEAPLEKVFPSKSRQETAEACPEDISGGQTGLCAEAASEVFRSGEVFVCGHKIGVPRVFIPVFPGTNCEYDSARAFERAGAVTDIRVFRNLSAQDIRSSVEEFEHAADQAQIIMFPGGFSAGDEPDGSAKFFATAFRNDRIREAVMRLLKERDGLALGICNGFQALIKLGLVPGGEITGQTEDSPTLTFNTIGRHVSRMVYTKVVTDKSPWLMLATPGETYVNPASHGEGRFVASPEWIERLRRNGQIATLYADCDGNTGLGSGWESEWNVNGSYAGIEGIISPDGRVLGRMCHSERRGSGVAVNISGNQDMKLFESGVEYFR